MQKNIKYLYYLIGILVVLGLAINIFSPGEKTPNIIANNNEIINLLAQWKKGNVIALVRHTERCDRSDNQCLEGSSGITLQGKDNAVKLGGYFKELLPLNNAIIYNSPVKRTYQTAKFMFGELSSNKMWLRKGCKVNLLKNIYETKKINENMILITHFTCMDKLGESQGAKLIDIDIDDSGMYGITVFVTINKESNQAYILGYLLISDWGGLIKESQLTKN